MQNRIVGTGVVAFALLGGGTLFALAQQPTGNAQPPAKTPAAPAEEADETPIKLADAPEAVRLAILKLASTDKIKKVVKEEQEGATIYEVEYTTKGGEHTATLSPGGHVMQVENLVEESKVPAEALAALKKAHPNATFKNHTAVKEFYYEMDVIENGKTKEIKFDAMGRVKDPAPVKEAEKDEKPATPATPATPVKGK